MKKYFFLTIASLLLMASAGFAQTNADAVLGTWLTGSGKGHVLVYKQGNQYFGKIAWISELNEANGKPKLDTKNPDAKKRTQPILGLVNLRNFSYDGDNVWDDGKVYDPETGKDYSCKMTLKDANTLDVRGFVGIALIGRTDTWKRVKK